MNRICNGNNLGISVIGKFQTLKRSHGIAWEADSYDTVSVIYPDHLLKHLTDTGGPYENVVASDHIKIKVKKISKRLAASKAHNVDRLSLEYNIDRRLKRSHIDVIYRMLNIGNIRLKNGGEDFALIALAESPSNLLYRSKLISHP